MDERMSTVDILRVDHEGVRNVLDPVILEVPLTIYLNGQEFVTLLYTPELAEMLAVGFLRSEGLIDKYEDVVSVRFDQEQGFVHVETKGGRLAEKLYGKRTITSGCGKGTVFFNVLDSLKSEPIQSDLKITADQIATLTRKLQDEAFLFKTTGGIHSAALCEDDKIVIFCEDIGRHNAVDKIVGLCLREGISLADKILVSSGRISSEILVKIAKLGIPILVSRTAPTSLSIELAQSLGITLIGFARGKRFNIYSHRDRVVIGEQ